MEELRHFERPQFVSVHYNDNVGQCDCEHHYSRKEAIGYVERMMVRELDKCKRLYPENAIEHTINYSEIHDTLNRSRRFIKISIDKEGVITQRWLYKHPSHIERNN